jgi:hypothetical protein
VSAREGIHPEHTNNAGKSCQVIITVVEEDLESIAMNVKSVEIGIDT